MSVTLRSARPGDAGIVYAFIRDLAEYEKLSHEMVATEADVERELFGDRAKVFCEIAEWEGKPVGFALWYYTFSTFLGRHGIWLEDLYVEPALRGKGVGKALLARLAGRCAREGLGRLEWSVLDWNRPAIDFYEAMGAVLQGEWTECRVEGDALRALADR